MSYPPDALGVTRRILPTRELAFAADREASHGYRPGRGSLGLNPSESNGFVLSPIYT